ncbi:MAG: tRNA uridine-5-carboxymethylaminomethyl(34) synthesis GTPase MnmE [Clostridia bacterium]|nr:tRNA uridine-5-carboxymethylaminomethyl(34) synthesis GTPase MnmE [Clostridia bacterium]
MNIFDTVAAVSTPRGKGGVAVIRISGKDTARLLSRVFRPAGKVSPAEAPRRAVFGSAISPADGSTIDSVLATFFASPASYTGEDMAEISCHGGVLVTRQVLSAVLAAGARHAEAGEFTRRAFVSGKLTLTEAEAVGELLDADTSDRLKLASSALGGKLSDKLKETGDQLLGAMTALYATIDYPEEDLADMSSDEVASAIESARQRIKRLLGTYKRGRAVCEGVRCVICGRPNAGKSSLYNLIVGEESAIVTDIAGTTRDVLRERVSFGGVTLELCDTAGLRDTDDAVESIGVDRAKNEIASAELVIAVFDGSCHLTAEEMSDASLYNRESAIAVINKSDVGCVLDSDELDFIENRHAKAVYMSCADGMGTEALEGAISELYDAGACRIGEEAVIWSARQQAELQRAEEYLREAADALSYGEAADAVCTLCEGALGHLMSTDGRGVTEEIVSGIFSRFCVGK